MAACAFWLASKVAKTLAGVLRRGSGITGFGGVWVAPVVIGTLSCALICTPPSRVLGAGFGTGTVCERAGVAKPATDVAIKSASPERSPRWVGCCVIRYFGSLFDEAYRCQPFYRAFDQRRYRFSVKIVAPNPPSAPDSRIRPLPPRPEFRVCRRDSPARRCLRVPSAPSTTRHGYSRFAAGVECRKSRPCGRA